MEIKEGSLLFTFPGESAIKFDETKFYRKKFNILPGSKGVDFVCDTKDFLLFLEVKDCLGQEADNNWRIAVNNAKVSTAPSSVDTENRESLDYEVSHKVAMTLCCLLGAQTFGDRCESAPELIRYVKAVEGKRIVNLEKKLLVVLFLEGDFCSDARSKEMNMSSIQASIEKKLRWLNCSVSVVDSNTYREKFFQVQRIPPQAER